MENSKVIEQIKGGLIVSCQALKTEPLYSSFIMSKMAYAAKLGGAVGIRANYTDDIKMIKDEVDLPVIGIIKEDYADSDIYITPTMAEIDALVGVGAEIIATDATNRLRPNGVTLQDFFKEAKSKYPNQLFMADISTYEEAIEAEALGFDFIGTTLAGYTEYTKGTSLPDYTLLERLTADCKAMIIAEGGIGSPEQLAKAYSYGIHSAVVGGAITRPMDITKKYVQAITK